MMQKLSARIVAVLLLLSLFQKMGMELWLHHFFHENARERTVHSTGAAVASVHCSCLDDTLMPMVGAETITLTLTVAVLRDRRPPATTSLQQEDRERPALRGPPQQA